MDEKSTAASGTERGIAPAAKPTAPSAAHKPTVRQPPAAANFRLLESACKSYMDAEGVEKVERAYRFAADYHRDQRRRSGEPYINHPVEVALILAKDLRMDEDTICAALLHDTVEDTDYTLDECRAELRAEGKKFDEKMEVGTMIETPAAVLIADELAEECDFFSIGTNDLTQYTCALDRQNAKLEPFFNPHHPAVLRAIKMTIDAGHRHGIWVGICGELGADTALTETFLRMGVDELSMNAKSVLPVRKIIRSIDLSKPSDK